MSKSTTVKSQMRNKPGPAPTGKGAPVMVRIQPDMLSPLDAFISDEHDAPSRPEAIRRIVRDWLIGHGYIKGDPQHGTRPGDLNASNDD